MKLYLGKVESIASEIVGRLVTDSDIEISDRNEAELDVVSVLKEYVRLDRELTERAKDVMEIRGLPYAQFGRIKRSLADQKEFGLGEDAIIWILNQLLETFMQSKAVDEVFADDATLRRKVRDILKKHMAVDEELDKEVRQRIKNLEEGSANWEIEYAKVMDQMKTRHGIKE